MDEDELLVNHYIINISKRAMGMKLKLSEGLIRIKFQMAEGFTDGRLSIMDMMEIDSQLNGKDSPQCGLLKLRNTIFIRLITIKVP